MSEIFKKKLSPNRRAIARYLQKLMQNCTEDEVIELRFLAEKRAFFAFVDADEKGAADRVRESKLFIPEMEVVTGTKPFLRNHMYFRFDEPMTDMLRWSELQKCLIKEFGTDTAIPNPSRLMRIAGSVAYPSASKLKRHYRAEVTKLLIGGKYVE